MMQNIASDLGEIKIHKNLIAQIAETATLQVPGVASLAITSDKLVSHALHFFKLTGIKVELAKTPKVEIPILVKYGYNIPDVSNQVQEEILKALSKSLNIDTAYVVVKIKGLENEPLFPKKVSSVIEKIGE